MIRDEMAEANHAPQSCYGAALCVIKKLYIENRLRSVYWCARRAHHGGALPISYSMECKKLLKTAGARAARHTITIYVCECEFIHAQSSSPEFVCAWIYRECTSDGARLMMRSENDSSIALNHSEHSLYPLA